MTSEPDGQGQRFIPSMCEKIQKVRTAFPQTECWADGGITLAAAQQLAAACGATYGDWARPVLFI